MQKPMVDEIKIKVHIDEHPDTSWLGEYTDEYPGDDELKRGSAFERNVSRGFDFKYFVPANSVQDHRKGLSRMGYSRSQAEDMAREYCRQDYARMEALSSGQWHFIGIQAEARVSYGTNPNGTDRRLEWFTSGGLWGIESDSNIDYLLEVANDEFADLREHLETFGVNLTDFDELVNDAIEQADL